MTPSPTKIIRSLSNRKPTEEMICISSTKADSMPNERENTSSVDQVVKINDSNYFRRLMLNSMRRTVLVCLYCICSLILFVSLFFEIKKTKTKMMPQQRIVCILMRLSRERVRASFHFIVVQISFCTSSSLWRSISSLFCSFPYKTSTTYFCLMISFWPLFYQ